LNVEEMMKLDRVPVEFKLNWWMVSRNIYAEEGSMALFLSQKFNNCKLE